MVAPTAAAMSSVKKFALSHAGVSHCEESSSGDMIRCTVTVNAAEELLQVQMYNYVHPKMPNTTVIRAANHYSLPASVSKHLDFVAPVNRFPPVRQQVKFTAANRPRAKRPLRTNTPKTLRELYNVGTVEGKAPGNKMACTAFLKQYYLKADLAKFYKKCVSSKCGCNCLVCVGGGGGGHPFSHV